MDKQWEAAGTEQEYTTVRNEITAWYQRMSVAYSFGVGVLGLLLQFQLNMFHREPGGGVGAVTAERNGYGCVCFLGWALIALVARTYALSTRQASYLQVFYEGTKRGWITHSRKAWKKHVPLPAGMWWIRILSEQRLFAVIVIATQLASGTLYAVAANWSKTETGWVAATVLVTIVIAVVTGVFRTHAADDWVRFWQSRQLVESSADNDPFADL